MINCSSNNIRVKETFGRYMEKFKDIKANAKIE